jgi:4-alpha-glucanotransferase
MDFARSGGILLHPTSLPGSYGIGDLGPSAHDFIDWLADAGCKLWQILPLGPTGYGDSPYQCFSAFAGNPFLVSPDLLLRDGLLSKSDLDNRPDLSVGALPADHVDYGAVIPWKLGLLARAFERFQESARLDLLEELTVFRAENADWLEDYSLFMALKELHGGGSWTQWPDPIRLRDGHALANARQSLAHAAVRHSFYQLLFHRQWSSLRDHAHRNGIRIVGDVPIYAAEDSADVWAHSDLFQLDEDRRPTVVAGVPPDYFSPTGQLWGNPLYRWEEHRRTGYRWWIHKLCAALNMVDYIRVDHFRGLAAYWEIPAGNLTAEIGRWVSGPAEDFLDTVVGSLREAHGDQSLPIIAEDLGANTPDVGGLLDRYRLPGMKILQFGFSDAKNPFLPHNYSPNCVAYTGTHDNDTARGWLNSAPSREARFALDYLHAAPRDFAWALIRGVWSSVAVFAIVPMQDVLNLGTEARMNYPSRAERNWAWRMRDDALTKPLGAKLRQFNELYGR